MTATQDNDNNPYANNPVIPLRPHHGMCLAYFEGKGYSQGFTSHMQGILDLLTKDAERGETESLVCLTIGTDVICEACPHNENGICSADEKVSGYDRKVLELCDLTPGETMPFYKLASRVQSEILSPEKRKSVCSGCQWEKLCEGKRSRWE
ncbi:MAG: DUF1284 domain-containing protein [Lachnospiraceae bacterium]|nr:DUF1284 domain-containing protein [Lachnospiraceae bacterium]